MLSRQFLSITKSFICTVTNTFYLSLIYAMLPSCRLLDGEGRGNLQTFCPTFKTSPNRLSSRLHSFDPASHLRFKSLCNFQTLDRFRCSWQVAVVTLWDSIPAELLLQGDCVGWGTVLKDTQRTIML